MLKNYIIVGSYDPHTKLNHEDYHQFCWNTIIIYSILQISKCFSTKNLGGDNLEGARWNNKDGTIWPPNPIHCTVGQSTVGWPKQKPSIFHHYPSVAKLFTPQTNISSNRGSKELLIGIIQKQGLCGTVVSLLYFQTKPRGLLFFLLYQQMGVMINAIFSFSLAFSNQIDLNRFCDGDLGFRACKPDLLFCFQP